MTTSTFSIPSSLSYAVPLTMISLNGIDDPVIGSVIVTRGIELLFAESAVSFSDVFIDVPFGNMLVESRSLPFTCGLMVIFNK